MATISRNVSTTLKKYMDRRQLSQTDLAKNAGCSQAAISRLATGARSVPSCQLLVSVADALNISLDELVGRTPPKQKIERRPSKAGETTSLSRTIALARAEKDQLARLGVRHLSLFGSLVTGAMRPDSDIDVLVDMGQKGKVTLLGLGEIQQHLAELFGRDVDVAMRNFLDPMLRDRILGEEVIAF